MWCLWECVIKEVLVMFGVVEKLSKLGERVKIGSSENLGVWGEKLSS